MMEATTIMTMAEAETEASRRGVELLRCYNTMSGWKHVYWNPLIGSFVACICHGKRLVYLGKFSTPYGAALAIALHLGPKGVDAELANERDIRARAKERQEAASCAEAQREAAIKNALCQPITAANVDKVADVLGVTLLRSTATASGYKYVRSNPSRTRFDAHVCEGQTRRHIGTFKSAAEAALCVARLYGSTPRTAAERATATAKEKGLRLERSAINPSGFKYVYEIKPGKFASNPRLNMTPPFQPKIFDSPEEAALHAAQRRRFAWRPDTPCEIDCICMMPSWKPGTAETEAFKRRRVA